MNFNTFHFYFFSLDDLSDSDSDFELPVKPTKRKKQAELSSLVSELIQTLASQQFSRLGCKLQWQMYSVKPHPTIVHPDSPIVFKSLKFLFLFHPKQAKRPRRKDALRASPSQSSSPILSTPEASQEEQSSQGTPRQALHKPAKSAVNSGDQAINAKDIYNAVISGTSDLVVSKSSILTIVVLCYSTIRWEKCLL